MKVDILVITAHPDDAELSCGGTIISAVAQGKKVVALDLTRGELGTRGTAETRAEEATAAAKIMGLSARDNALLPDGFLANTRDQQMAILPFIRKYRPEIVITNAIRDRHPDHGKASELVSDACFLSGLKAIETSDRGQTQSAWRPRAVYHIIQDRRIEPDFIVDISDSFEQKMEAIQAYKTQFYTGEPQKEEEVTPISTPAFMDGLKSRAREYGRLINVEYGEGFTTERPAGVKDLSDLL
ncbi:MAG: bacillithiol biosynthesis deacetylase BshB1 [Cryomorphaceae bacterium]|nr:bacillithiol biosynthesis deacetylase BshB1 [Flavobacteriales bacterium]